MWEDACKRGKYRNEINCFEKIKNNWNEEDVFGL